MENGERKISRIFTVSVVICFLVLPFLVHSAFSKEPVKTEKAGKKAQDSELDQYGVAIFDGYFRISSELLKGTSATRTLEEYYSRRQYPGSPPYIPHKIPNEDEEIECLACHEEGGWVEDLSKNAPITPHPEQAACRQCHLKVTTGEVFVKNDWVSVSPPRLGRSALPGSPPPIPHSRQMRENCPACHVGPGAVDVLRVEHASRGDCRQCHLPNSGAVPFQRNAQSY